MSEHFQHWAQENLAQPAEHPIAPEDEGELFIRVFVKDGVLVIDFGKEVSWVGLTRDTAQALIGSIRERLSELE